MFVLFHKIYKQTLGQYVYLNWQQLIFFPFLILHIILIVVLIFHFFSVKIGNYLTSAARRQSFAFISLLNKWLFGGPNLLSRRAATDIPMRVLSGKKTLQTDLIFIFIFFDGVLVHPHNIDNYVYIIRCVNEFIDVCVNSKITEIR